MLIDMLLHGLRSKVVLVLARIAVVLIVARIAVVLFLAQKALDLLLKFVSPKSATRELWILIFELKDVTRNG